MAKYSCPMNKGTPSTSVGVGCINAAATGMRRNKIYDLMFGSEATPGDVAILHRIARSSTAHTGTSVTPSPLDEVDAAAGTIVKENLSAEGTVGVQMLEIPLNQRATFRWVAAPGSELVTPNTADDGFIFQTPTMNGGTPAITIGAMFEEQ